MSTAHPKTLLSTIGIAEDLALAIRFLRSSPLERDAASSSDEGTQTNSGQQVTWRGGRRGTRRWGRGGG